MPIDFDYSTAELDDALFSQLDELEEFVSEGDVETDRVFEEEEGGDVNLRRRLDSVVVINNLPKDVPPEKLDKLKGVVLKIFTGKSFGNLQEGGFEMPVSEDGKTLGFAFLAYEKQEGALQAIKLLDGFKMPPNFVLEVFPFSNLEKSENWPEEYQEPTLPEFTTGPNLSSWLMQPGQRDQYLIRHGTMTEIYWCEGMMMGAQGTLVYDGARERENGKIWCEMWTAWSPQGSYLATCHRQGIALWGGDDFQKIRRFAHPDVTELSFSPEEKFLLTWNGIDDNKNARALILWNIKTGREVKCFKVAPPLNDKDSAWPVMKWSPDDSYFARMIFDGISVFESKTGRLLEKKPVRTNAIREFLWSPSDNLIAYWAPEKDSLPARVVLLDPVSRSEIRSKNLFNVREVKLHWQDAGDFLCAQVLRHTKSGKTTFTNFEIFRMRDANIPNEMLEIRDVVEHFSWEPRRERFGIIHGPTPHRLSISFYSAGSIRDGSKLSLLYTIPSKQFNMLHWSPLGNAVVFAGEAISGEFEFWDVDENVCTGQEEHFMCNEFQWDPSGRILATIVAQPMFGSVQMKYQLENGYNLWSFQGQSLRKEKMEKFYQFLWRPRPKTVLDDDEVQKVMRGLKGYMNRYGREDEIRRKRLEASANTEKIEALSAFRELIEKRTKEAKGIDEERRRLGLIPAEDDDEYDTIEELEEVFVSEKVEPL